MKIAQDIQDIFGKVKPPAPVAGIGSGAAGISNFLTKIIELIYMVAGIIFIFMIILGAFQWITSGGDKDNIDKARKRITNAIIGIVLLALAFLIISIIGKITGFEFFKM